MACAFARMRGAVKALSSLVLLLATGVLFAPGQSDGEGDLLDHARRLQGVAAQKVEADLRRALQDAERLTRVDRAKAIQCLKNALEQIEADTALAPHRREAWMRMLRDRIRVTESETDTPPAGATDTKNKPVRPSHGLEARRHPQDPAAQAAEQTKRNAEQVDNARRLQQGRERSLLSGYSDIDRSATLPNGDYEFPKDWKERTKGRTAAVALTAKEKSILEAMNRTISVNFRDSKLLDVIEFLQTYTGLAILLDREGMKDAEISYDTPITLNVKGVTVRTLLRKILGDLGMTYVIKGETIQATSAQKARELMVVRRYYVGDLLAGMGGLGPWASPPGGFWNPGVFPGAVLPNFNCFPFGPAVNPQLQVMNNRERVKQLIELVQSSVDPQSWQANGGNGTITFHAPSMSLIIKQSAEVHTMLETSGLLP